MRPGGRAVWGVPLNCSGEGNNMFWMRTRSAGPYASQSLFNIRLETVEVVGAQNKCEGDGGDDDLAEGADDEGTRTLFEEVAQVGA
jgi:hypothetical protein